MPFEASLNLKAEKLTLFITSAVICMSDSPEPHISWPPSSNFPCHLFPCSLLFSLWGLKLFLFNFYLLSPPIAIISHCWVCWLPPPHLYFWRVSECLHHDFVSLLSLSVRLLFLIIAPLFPVCFSSFQPHFLPPDTFDCLSVLVCGYVCVPVCVCVCVCLCVCAYGCVPLCAFLMYRAKSVFAGISAYGWARLCVLCMCASVVCVSK